MYLFSPDRARILASLNMVYQQVDQASCPSAGLSFVSSVCYLPHRFQNHLSTDLISNVRCSGNGRNCICSSNKWGTLLLGSHTSTERLCSILVLDYWMVSCYFPLRVKLSIMKWELVILTISRFNLLGQVAVTTGITFGCAGLISTTATVQSSYTPTAARTLGIYAALLVSHTLVNSFGVKILRYLNDTSVVLHSIGVSCFAIAVLAKAPTHQSAKFVFATFYDGTGETGSEGWSMRASPAYVAVCGILMAQYTITGYDASAHLSEETNNASWNAPLGVLMSVGVSAVFGFFLIISLLFSIQDFQGTVDSTVGQPVTQILIDIFGPKGAIALMTLIICCVWHAGLFSLTSNSRMMFAFARDRGLPPFFDHVDEKFGSPIRTVCLAAFLAFLLAIPSLGSSVAFSAATSIATIGLYISYGLPILIGFIYHDSFQKGPFNLRWASRPIAMIACLYIGFITIVFCLPELNPVTSQTLNYTPVAVGIVAAWAFGSWFLWARRWFTGPIRQIEEERMGIDISDPAKMVQAEEKLDEKVGIEKIG